MSESESIVGVIVNIIRRETPECKILFLRRSGGKYEGQWWPVGGTCEPGEQAIETARRELKEETDLIADEIYQLGRDVPHVDDVSRLVGYVAFVGPDAVVTLNYEHSDFKWVSVPEALALLPDKVHNFIHFLESRFIKTRPEKSSLVWAALGYRE